MFSVPSFLSTVLPSLAVRFVELAYRCSTACTNWLCELHHLLTSQRPRVGSTWSPAHCIYCRKGARPTQVHLPHLAHSRSCEPFLAKISTPTRLQGVLLRFLRFHTYHRSWFRRLRFDANRLLLFNFTRYKATFRFRARSLFPRSSFLKCFDFLLQSVEFLRPLLWWLSRLYETSSQASCPESGIHWPCW